MATEKRLIDVNKVINSMQKCLDESPDQKYTVAYFAFESIIAALKQEPTVDAVEVVRCKDCKYWENGKDHEPYCNHCVSMMSDSEPDDFCSYGERKDNDL